jgi:hypothetical protein
MATTVLLLLLLLPSSFPTVLASKSMHVEGDDNDRILNNNYVHIRLDHELQKNHVPINKPGSVRGRNLQTPCTLCRDGSVPKNPTKGVVIEHLDYHKTGTAWNILIGYL